MRVSRVPSANASTRARPTTAACRNRRSARAYGSIEPLTSQSSTTRRGRGRGHEERAPDGLTAGTQRPPDRAPQVGVPARSPPARPDGAPDRRSAPTSRRSAMSRRASSCSADGVRARSRGAAAPRRGSTAPRRPAPAHRRRRRSSSSRCTVVLGPSSARTIGCSTGTGDAARAGVRSQNGRERPVVDGGRPRARRTSVARPAQYTWALGGRARRRPSARRVRHRAADGHVEPAAAQHPGERHRDPLRLVRHVSSPSRERSRRGRQALRCSRGLRRSARRGRAARTRSWSSRYLRTVPSVTSTASFVERASRPSARERVRPVDRLGDTRRLVQLEVAERLDRGRDLRGERLRAPPAPGAARSRARARSRGARSSGRGSAASARRARRGCGST